MSTCFFTNVGNYQQEIKLLAFSPLVKMAFCPLITAMTNAFKELKVVAADREGVGEQRLEGRWVVNLCHTFDARMVELDASMEEFFSVLKERMENPQDF